MKARPEQDGADASEQPLLRLCRCHGSTNGDSPRYSTPVLGRHGCPRHREVCSTGGDGGLVEVQPARQDSQPVRAALRRVGDDAVLTHGWVSQLGRLCGKTSVPLHWS